MTARLRLALVASVLFVLSTAVANAGSVTIVVTSVTVTNTYHDIGPKGASAGDTVVGKDKLLNAAAQFARKKGAGVGVDRGTLLFTGPHTATFRGVATLPDGTLILQGVVTGLKNGGLIIPVTGGTGRYAKARGTLTVGPGKTRALNTYRLVLPNLPVA